MCVDSAWVLWALFNGFRFTSFFRRFVFVIYRFNNSPSKCSVFSVNFTVSHAATLSTATRQALSMVCQCCMSSVSSHIRSVSSITEETSSQSYVVFIYFLFIQYLQYTSQNAQLRGKSITWQSEYYCTKNINLYRHTWINYFYRFRTEKLIIFTGFIQKNPFKIHSLLTDLCNMAWKSNTKVHTTSAHLVKGRNPHCSRWPTHSISQNW